MNRVKSRPTCTSRDGQRRISYDQSARSWLFEVKADSGSFVYVNVTPKPVTKAEAHKWLRGEV